MQASTNQFQLSPRDWAIIAALVAVGIAARLSGLPANVSPTAAIVLFAGFLFARRWPAALIAVATLAITDVFLGSYEPGLMASVYLAMLFPLVWSGWLRKKTSALRIGSAAVASSSVFFLASNFGVWAFTPWYAGSFEGLLSCYVAALPFYQYTVFGDLLWSITLFGGHALLTQQVHHDQRQAC